MKKAAVILLMVLLSALISPLTIIASPSESGSFLVTLDVCSSSGSFMSMNADSPAIQECPCKLLPLAFVGYMPLMDPSHKPAIIVFTQERPPQA
ncbi:MAG: hypothetical protein HZB62_04835 [Nitrospirae bacterium]|nr:hypothetical protein [Nitrospirota bacterium]